MVQSGNIAHIRFLMIAGGSFKGLMVKDIQKICNNSFLAITEMKNL